MDMRNASELPRLSAAGSLPQMPAPPALPDQSAPAADSVADSSGSLPSDLIADASRRLSMAMLVIAAVLVFYNTLYATIWSEHRFLVGEIASVGERRRTMVGCDHGDREVLLGRRPRRVANEHPDAERTRVSAARSGPFAPGETVVHPQWGEGTVQRIEGEPFGRELESRGRREGFATQQLIDERAVQLVDRVALGFKPQLEAA